MLESCCNYGGNGQGTNGFDCVGIPGAETATRNTVEIPSVFCGRDLVQIEFP